MFYLLLSIMTVKFIVMKTGGDNMYIGERIRLLRKRDGLTQEKLAKRVNCSQNSIAKYETGRSEPPADTLRQLAMALDTTVDYLVGMPDAPISRKAQTSPEFSKIIEVTADFSKAETAKLLDYAIMLKKSR